MIISKEEYEKIIKLDNTHQAITSAICKMMKGDRYTEVEKCKLGVIEAATKIRRYPKGVIKDTLLAHPLPNNQYEVTDMWLMSKRDLIECMHSISMLEPFATDMSRQMKYREKNVFQDKSNKMESKNIRILIGNIRSASELCEGIPREKEESSSKLNTLINKLFHS